MHALGGELHCWKPLYWERRYFIGSGRASLMASAWNEAHCQCGACFCCGAPRAGYKPALPVPVSYTHLDVYKRQGVDKDLINAMKWYLLASAQNSQEAADRLKSLKPLLTAEQRITAEVRAEAFQKARQK